MSTPETCGSCQFFVRDERKEYASNGRCWRFPPQTIWVTNEHGNSDWWQVPRSYLPETDWCGEYKMAPVQEHWGDF